MRKLFFILVFIFCCNLSFSQTATSKYNSILQRYEYFDANGDLIGYKVYNNIRGQWEYYAETPQKPNENKYGEVKSPIDIDLMGRVLMSKQNSYNYNNELVKKVISDITNRISNCGASSDTRYNALITFAEIVGDMEIQKLDLSSSRTTNNVITYLYQWYDKQLNLHTK